MTGTFACDCGHTYTSGDHRNLMAVARGHMLEHLADPDTGFTISIHPRPVPAS